MTCYNVPWREGRRKLLQGDRVNYLKASGRAGVPSPDVVPGHLQPRQVPESEGQAGLFLRKILVGGKGVEGGPTQVEAIEIAGDKPCYLPKERADREAEGMTK